MRDVIPVATLVLAEILIVAFGGMRMYRLVSGNINRRTMLAKTVRREGLATTGERSRLLYALSG
jgi:hypothetical protein